MRAVQSKNESPRPRHLFSSAIKLQSSVVLKPGVKEIHRPMLLSDVKGFVPLPFSFTSRVNIPTKRNYQSTILLQIDYPFEPSCTRPFFDEFCSFCSFSAVCGLFHAQNLFPLWLLMLPRRRLRRLFRR